MKIKELVESPKVTVSCEVFPPKKGTELANACQIVRTIAGNGVDYMSVTYGAGGTAVGKSLAIAAEIERSGVPALAHLTCVGAKNQAIEEQLDRLKAEHIDNILALRGDLPQGMAAMPDSDFTHASDLVKKIKSYGDFCVGGTAYPEGHPEAASLDEDLEHTKYKVACGCDFLVTQMFFDNNMFYNFMCRLLAKGIRVPVAGGEDLHAQRDAHPVQAEGDGGAVRRSSGSTAPGRDGICDRADHGPDRQRVQSYPCLYDE